MGKILKILLKWTRNGTLLTLCALRIITMKAVAAAMAVIITPIQNDGPNNASDFELHSAM